MKTFDAQAWILGQAKHLPPEARRPDLGMPGREARRRSILEGIRKSTSKTSGVTRESVARGMAMQHVRTDLGMTQKDVSISLGVNRSTVKRWEAGEAKPTKKARSRIKSLLGWDFWGAPMGVISTMVPEPG